MGVTQYTSGNLLKEVRDSDLLWTLCKTIGLRLSEGPNRKPGSLVFTPAGNAQTHVASEWYQISRIYRSGGVPCHTQKKTLQN